MNFFFKLWSLICFSWGTVLPSPVDEELRDWSLMIGLFIWGLPTVAVLPTLACTIGSGWLRFPANTGYKTKVGLCGYWLLRVPCVDLRQTLKFIWSVFLPACLRKQKQKVKEKQTSKRHAECVTCVLFMGKLGNCHLISEKTKVCFPGEIFMGGTGTFQGNIGFWYIFFFFREQISWYYLGTLTSVV